MKPTTFNPNAKGDLMIAEVQEEVARRGWRDEVKVVHADSLGGASQHTYSVWDENQNKIYSKTCAYKTDCFEELFRDMTVEIDEATLAHVDNARVLPYRQIMESYCQEHGWHVTENAIDDIDAAHRPLHAHKSPGWRAEIVDSNNESVYVMEADDRKTLWSALVLAVSLGLC